MVAFYKVAKVTKSPRPARYICHPAGATRRVTNIYMVGSIFIGCFFWVGVLYGQPLELVGRAVSVSDGDTFTLLVSGDHRFRIRLNGIDAPEKGQDYFKVSKDALGKSLNSSGNQLRVRYWQKDRYGRILGNVYTREGQLLNLTQVRNGMAWHFVRYSRDTALAGAERSARKAKAGLWKLPNPTAPWEFRKIKKYGQRSKNSYPAPARTGPTGSGNRVYRG